MKERFEGIVLRTVRLGDTSLLVDLLTRQSGRKQFVAHVGSGRRRRGSGALWQALSMVEFMADTHSRSSLPHVSDAMLQQLYTSISVNPMKQMVAMFLAEFMSNVLHGEQRDEPLYEYVRHSLLWLDMADGRFADFHLIFMVHLTKFVGIMPNISQSGNTAYFDLRSATFTDLPPIHPDFLQPNEAAVLPLLLRMSYSSMHLLRLSRTQRQRILALVIRYYELHMPSMPRLRSLDVLRELLD